MLFIHSSCIFRLGCPCVDDLAVVLDNLFDESLLEQFLKCLAGKRASHLESLRDNRGCDQLVAGHLFEKLVVRGLVEEHQVVQLVTHFSLGPLLLLGLASGGSLLLLGSPLRVSLFLTILFGRLKNVSKM